jgi:hypothetical protein
LPASGGARPSDCLWRTCGDRGPRLRRVRSVVSEDASRTHRRDRDSARRRARVDGRPRPHAPAEVGPTYPIGLTSFPYVDYHPGLPYSVFLAPGAAQVNLPQVYWKDIGGSVDAVSARTWAHNRIYGVPIAPLGQTYQSPAPAEIQRFRQVWAAYGAGGLWWWSW